MKNTLFLSLFFLTSLAFAGKKYEDQVIERITCPTQKCEEGQTLEIEIPSLMEETSAEAVEKYGLKPKAKILGYGHAGVRPEVMGVGPIPAVQNLLKKTGLVVSDFDVIESNEAFAAQAIAVNRGLNLDPVSYTHLTLPTNREV